MTVIYPGVCVVVTKGYLPGGATVLLTFRGYSLSLQNVKTLSYNYCCNLIQCLIIIRRSAEL